MRRSSLKSLASQPSNGLPTYSAVGVRIEHLPTPADCRDGFFEAYWRRPEAALDPGVRASQSLWALLSEGVEERIVDRLPATWNRANGIESTVSSDPWIRSMERCGSSFPTHLTVRRRRAGTTTRCCRRPRRRAAPRPGRAGHASRCSVRARRAPAAGRSSALTVGPMMGSNAGPPRCKPPTSACSFGTPVSRCAWRTMLTAPAWPQPVSTTRPWPRTCTTRA